MGVWLQMGGEAPLRGFTLDVSTPDWPDPGMVFRSVDPGPAYPRRGPAGYDDRDFARFDLVGPTPMPHSDSLFQCSARIRRPRAAAGSAPALGGGRCGRDSPWKVAVGLSSAHRHFSLPHKAGPHHDGRMADSLSGDSRPARGCGRRGNPETGAKPGSNSICDCFSATFAGFTREFMAHEGHANASSRAGEQ